MTPTIRLALFGLTACLVAVAGSAGALAQDKAKKAAAKGKCVTHFGRGWAPTESMAKFQAWEIVAQTTGNWPFPSDKLTNERYSCKPDGSQIRCDSKIDVCKS